MIGNLVRGGSDISDGPAALRLGVICRAAGGRRSSIAAISSVLSQSLSVEQQLQREVPELNELVTGESSCEGKLQLQGGLAYRVDPLPPGWRESSLDRATIVGVGQPLHEASFFEAVDQAGDVARAHALQLCQAAEAEAAVAGPA